jgi:hypothetical protein
VAGASRLVYLGAMKSWEIERVRRHTSPRTNERIDRTISATIRTYGMRTEGAITRRLDELEREWDIERLLETNASSLALLGVVLSITSSRRWLALSGGVLGFLLLHGVQGWCPPLPLLRRLGVRTRGEIDRERFALRYLRGDFDLVRKPTGEINLAALVHAVEL